MVVRDDVAGRVEHDTRAESLRVLDLNDRGRELVHDRGDRLLECERSGGRLETGVARLRRFGGGTAPERDCRDDHSGGCRTGERKEPPDVPAHHALLIPASGLLSSDFRPTISWR